jgi:hypothetical protein
VPQLKDLQRYLLLPLFVLSQPQNKSVILSEGTHSTTVSAAAEGPAAVFAVAVVCPSTHTKP